MSHEVMPPCFEESRPYFLLPTLLPTLGGARTIVLLFPDDS